LTEEGLEAADAAEREAEIPTGIPGDAEVLSAGFCPLCSGEAALPLVEAEGWIDPPPATGPLF
jgi:hypothetical protein